MVKEGRLLQQEKVEEVEEVLRHSIMLREEFSEKQRRSKVKCGLNAAW